MFDKENVTKILKSFYTLTGVKVVILDSDFTEVLSYPHTHCDFCAAVNASHGESCRKSEMEFCKRASSLMNLYTGRCHANLVEAVLPIVDSGLIAGYMMFGQILPEGEDKTAFPEYVGHLGSIVRKSAEEIAACTDVLRGLAHYIMSMHPAAISEEDMGLAVARYINENLGEDLSVDSLCKRFLCSRSKLYAATRPHMPKGIAAYVKWARLSRAKEYLEKTELSVKKISVALGYGDYNYFCRDFKKSFGMPAIAYRVYYRNKKI